MARATMSPDIKSACSTTTCYHLYLQPVHRVYLVRLQQACSHPQEESEEADGLHLGRLQVRERTFQLRAHTGSRICSLNEVSPQLLDDI